MLTYSDDNKFGRQAAAQAIHECRITGDLPRLVQKVREAATGDDGISVGFLYALAEMAGESRNGR